MTETGSRPPSTTRAAGSDRRLPSRHDHGPSEAPQTLEFGRRAKWVVALVFFVFAVVELWAPIIHGGWYLPSDIGQLFPLTRVAGHPIRVKNLLPSDVYVQLAPFVHFTVQQVAAGHLPTWSTTQGNGLPFLANEQSVVFSPFTVVFYLLPFRVALIAAAVARLWILGFFSFLFLLRHRLHPVAAVVGGIAFAYAGYHLVWLDYQTVVSVSAWLPVALFCSRVALDADPVAGSRGRRVGWSGAACAVAAMLVGGNPETATFDILTVAAYVVVVLVVERRGVRHLLRAAFGLAAALAVGIGLSAVQLLPFLQYQSISTREAAIRADPSVVIPGFDVDASPLIAFPDLFGAPQYGNADAAFSTWLRPPTNYAESDGNSVGLLTVCLVPVGLLTLRRRRREALPWFGLGAAVVGSLLLYCHAAGDLWTHVPLLHAAYLNRTQDVEVLGFCVLAALGVDRLVRPGPAARARPSLAGRRADLSVFVGVGLAFSLAAFFLRRHVEQTTGGGSASAALSHDQSVIEIVLAAAFLVLALVHPMLCRRRIARWLPGGLMALVVFASTGLVFRSYNPTVSSWAFYPRTPAIAQLQRVVGGGEALFTGGSFPSPATSRWWGIDEVGAYDLDLAAHDDLYRRVFGVPAIGEAMPRCVAGLRLFGVTTVVGGSGAFASGAALTRSGSIAGVPYYRVPDSSHFSLVGSAVEAPGDRPALRLVSSCRFDSSKTVVLDPPTFDAANPAPLGPRTGGALHGGRLQVLSNSSTNVRLVVDAPRPAWLLVRESWAPGWRATVGGRGTPVERADVTFQAVRVPAGTHVVDLFYDPGTLTTGIFVSAAAAGLLVVVLMSALAPPALAWRRRRAQERGDDQRRGSRRRRRGLAASTSA